MQEFTDRFGPTQADYDAVQRFAGAHGMTVTETAANRLPISVSASAGDIEKAFNLELGLYRHPTENRTFFSPDREPSVSLNVALWHIGGMDNFSLPKPLVRKAFPAVAK